MRTKRYRRKTSGPVDADEFLEVIGSIYEAALEPARWKDAMSTIARAIGGHRAQMFVPDARPGQSLWVSHAIAPEMLAGYAEHYRHADLWTDRCARFLTASGSTISSEMVAEDGEYLRSEFWNDFTRPADIFRVACVAVDIPADAPASGTLLAVYRPRASEQFDDEARAFLARIQPHVLRSLKLHRLLSDAASERATLDGMLAMSSKPMFACTRTGLVAYANRAGEALVRSGTALAIRGNRLIADSPSLSAQLASAIARAAGGSKRSQRATGDSLSLPDSRGGPPLSITVAPLHLPNATARVDAPAAIVIAHCRSFAFAKVAERLRTAYRLTDAELRLVEEMERGGSLVEVAARIGVRPNTARSHLKQVFAKTGTKRQAELVRLVQGFAA